MKEWEYDEINNKVTGIDNGNLRIQCAIPYGTTPEQVLYHGRLIAAAPDMYQLLKNELIPYIESYTPIPTDYIAIINDLIDKIENK